MYLNSIIVVEESKYEGNVLLAVHLNHILLQSFNPL